MEDPMAMFLHSLLSKIYYLSNIVCDFVDTRKEFFLHVWRKWSFFVLDQSHLVKVLISPRSDSDFFCIDCHHTSVFYQISIHEAMQNLSVALNRAVLQCNARENHLQAVSEHLVDRFKMKKRKLTKQLLRDSVML